MQNFQVIKSLGEGAFSQVFKVKRISDGQEYALKKVKMGKLTEKERQNALNEVRILASIQHPNIISYKESFMEDRTSTLCIVMEYADNGDLLQKITAAKSGKSPKIPEQTCWSYLIQMLHGLQALHDRQIVHRDIKCANVFLTRDGTVKLGDLNVSKVAKRGLLQTQTGTPYYASPEVWQDKPYDHKSDIWSLGCVIYEMCSLQPPFRANDMNQLFKRVCEGRIPPLPAQYSKDLMYMIKLCLQLDPKLRPNCVDMLARDQISRNTPSALSLSLNTNEDLKLIGTIRVPRNLGQITERLPAANYQSLNRQQSLPAMRPNDLNMQSQSNASQHQSMGSIPGSAVGNKGRGGSLATIKERDEVRSADPSVSKSRAMAAAAQNGQMAVKNQPIGYGRGQQQQAGNNRSNQNMPQHRTPVITSGKENSLQLPPIDGRSRVSGKRSEAAGGGSNLRNSGAAIMGSHNTNSAHQLNNYQNDIRDSMGAHKKYGSYDYQGQIGQRQQYVKGNCYNVEPNMASPRLSLEERQIAGHLSPTQKQQMMGHQQYSGNKQHQYAAHPASLAPRPEMFMATPQSNYQQAFGVGAAGQHQATRNRY